MTGNESAAGHEGISRRSFLELASAQATGLALGSAVAGKCAAARRERPTARAVILINNYGGPSHLDLFDMKPDAPREIRGPFRPVRTSSDEFEISELLPLHARIADRFSLVRTCHHDAGALHDTASIIIQTGRIPQPAGPNPHPGAVASCLLGKETGRPCNYLVNTDRAEAPRALPAQTAAQLGEAHQPAQVSPREYRREIQGERKYFGSSRIGDSLLTARRLIEAGARFVTVNTFNRTRGSLGWDMHGRRGFSTLDDLQARIAPRYDRAYWGLITSLEERGMLRQTLVCCLGEFGRSPVINPAGGRDHWTGCWSVYFAGGGIEGGRAVGRSDKTGSCPADRPTDPAEITATIYHCLGISEKTATRLPGTESSPILSPAAGPIEELF